MEADRAKPVTRPFEGEDIQTTHWEDARHWMSIYDDLIRFKLGLLDRVARELPKLHPVAQAAADEDVRFIEAQGVQHVFMVPGGGAMHLNDSLGQSTSITWVCNLHEQASAMAAETYAKATGNLGVAMFTTGPGSTNAITGVAGAWLDSTPCLFISGQVKRPDLKGKSGVRQMGVQEIDIVSAVRAMTKYAVLVTDPQSIRYHLEKGVHLARTGRPGPVWLDIPLDVQAATIDETGLRAFRAPRQRRAPTDLAQRVAEVAHMLGRAERPIILAGNGVRLAGAQEVFRALARSLKVPVLLTWLAIDMFAHDEENLVGKPGTVAPRGVNFALQNADFLLVIGARMDFTITGYAPERLARGAKKIMIDIDPAEIAKLAPYLDLSICCDAKAFIDALANATAAPNGSSATPSCCRNTGSRRDWSARIFWRSACRICCRKARRLSREAQAQASRYSSMRCA